MGVLLQRASKLCRSKGAAAIGAVANGGHIRFLLSGLKVGAPIVGVPALAPYAQIQPGRWGRRAAVHGCRRPWPIGSLGHEQGANRVEFHIAQSLPQVVFVQRAGVEAPLPHVAAGAIDGVPIGSESAMSIF